MGSSKEEPQFFPNPRYIEGLPDGITVAGIRRATESGELQAFWGPTSRGVELESQPGWYFTGRERVLRELSQWLNDPADGRTRRVRGLEAANLSSWSQPQWFCLLGVSCQPKWTLAGIRRLENHSFISLVALCLGARALRSCRRKLPCAANRR
jgi:hypothetical protein